MAIKILVTGSHGQLGRSLQQIAATCPGFTFIFTGKDELAIENEAVVRYFFEKYTPDYCINCAAYTAVDAAEEAKEICYAVNATGPKNLAEIALLYNCKVIHISTDYVFDGKKQHPYTEKDTPNPVNYYGISKLAGEAFVIKTNPQSIIVRTSWVYSPYGKNFVKTMMRLMETKPKINVVEDQIGSPTYALSLAKVLLRMISHMEQTGKESSGIYHYSSEAAISWFDFAVAIQHMIHSSCVVHPIKTIEYPTPAVRSLYCVMDKTKIKKEFDLHIHEWKSDLQHCIDALQNLTF